MPQTRPTLTGSGLAPVPVGIFLPTPPRTRPAGTRASARHGDWYGVTPHDTAHLVAALTKRGDLVIDLDEHPTITHAARFLGRQPAHLTTDGQHHRVRPAPPARRLYGHPAVGLLLARLPRAGADSGDLHAMTGAMHTWRGLLRPGGYLLTALAAPHRDGGLVGHRATLITAARAAGLSWCHELLVALVALPEHEPRAMPDTAAGTRAALADGRHDVVHVKLLVFRLPVGGGNA
jgi:hypothetical protein